MKTLLTIILLLGVSPILSHNPIRGKAERYIRKAQVIAIVMVRNVQVLDNNCSVTTIVTVVPKKIIKGHLPKGIRLNYQYTDHIWKKGCPSVHYMYGPRARPIKKGKTIIVTAGSGFSGWKGWWVTSSYNMDQLKRIKKLMKK